MVIDQLDSDQPRKVKAIPRIADQMVMALDSRLPAKAGPVPDRLSIWPIDDGRYGLDATFQGASGFERAEVHQTQLVRDGIPA